MSFLKRFSGGGAERTGGAPAESVTVAPEGSGQEAVRRANMVDYYARSGMPAEAMARQLMETCGGEIAKVDGFLGDITARQQVIAAKVNGR